MVVTYSASLGHPYRHHLSVSSDVSASSAYFSFSKRAALGKELELSLRPMASQGTSSQRCVSYGDHLVSSKALASADNGRAADHDRILFTTAAIERDDSGPATSGAHTRLHWKDAAASTD